MTEGATGPVVVLRTARWLPPGLLSAAGWDALRASALLGAAGHPLLDVPDVRDLLAASGYAAIVVGGGPAKALAAVRAAARDAGSATWLAAPDGADAEIVDALLAGGATVVVGSADPPGARLLDAVRIMDRLRSPGGCPWDAEQTHDSLAKYLLEEAYETVELIESGQLAALAEEIGDVLLQVLFHARVASERADGTGWDVDDAAGGLVEKLVRRHPHVFGGLAVDGTAEVVANWDVLKAQEKGRTSVTEGVPLAQAALALAEKLLARSGRAGLPDTLADAGLVTADPAAVLRDLLAAVPHGVARDADDAATDAATDAEAEAYVGRVLLLAVVLARRLGVNPETALRAAARGYRDRITDAEASARRSDSGR